MDDSTLRDRLQALEARVAQLEGLLGQRAAAAPPRAAPPPSSPPPPVETSHAAPPPERIVAPSRLPPAGSVFAKRAGPRRPRAPKRDLERFVGLAVLGRAGIAAVLLAAAYFGQLGWAHLGPAARASLVYVSGLLMVGAGVLLRARVDAKYTALLWGGGTALTYVAGVLAHLRYEVFSSGAAVASLLGSAALGQFLAHRLRLEMLATVALAGAYAAPVLVGTPSPSPTAFFALLLALHAWGAWTEHRWHWHHARGLAVVSTVVLVIGWYLRSGTGPLWSFVGHVEAVWLLLIAPEVIAALRGALVSDLRAVLAGSGGLFAHLALLLRFAEHDERSLFPPFAACALLGAGALLVPRCAALGTWLARAGSVLLPLGTVVAATRLTFPMEGQPDVHWWCLGGLVGVAVLLAVVRRWTRVAELGMTLAALLEVAIGSLGVLGRERAVPMLAATLLLLVVSRTTPARLAGLLLGVIAAPMGLLPMHSLVGEGSSWMALTFALACGVATLALLVGSRVRDRVLATVAALVELVVLVKWIEEALGANAMNVASDTLPLWNARTGALAAIVALAVGGRMVVPAADVASRALLGVTALAGTFCGGLFELLDAAAQWSPGARDVATSLYVLAFAGVLLAAGFWRKLAAVRWTALALFGIAAVKVVTWDMRDTDTPMRVLATGVLGGVLLLAAWAYARRHQRAGDQSAI